MRFLEDVRIVLLITLLTTINAKDFYISFSFATKNYKLIYQKFNCSDALVTINAPKRYLFSLPCESDIKKCCYENQEEIINRLLNLGVVSTSNEYLTQKSFKSNLKLTLLPKRFDIILKDGVMKFYLKEDE